MRSLTLLALVALLAAALPAQAQFPPGTLALEGIKSPPHPIEPDGPAADMLVTWRYSPPNSAGNALGTGGKAVIHWTFKCQDSGFSVSGPTTTEVTFEPTGNSYTGEVTLKVTATSAAPGLVLSKCMIIAYADSPGPGQPESNEVQQVFAVVAAFKGTVQAVVEAPEAKAAPGSPIPFRIQLHSRANAQAVVKVAADGLGDGWAVELPEPTLLGPDETKEVEVRVLAPAGELWTNREREITFSATPTAALDMSLTGDASTVPVLARSQGVTVVSPSGGLALLILLALGGTFADLRRRQGKGPAPPDSGPGPSGP